MTLSIDRLHTLVEEDQRKRQRQDETREARWRSKAPLRKNLQQIWQAHGVLSPTTGCWIRPLPDSLYRCSLSSSQTTLVLWSSLPQSVRSQLPKEARTGNDDDGEDRIVEIPLAYIQIDEEGSGGREEDSDKLLNSLKSRTTVGNLSNKLSEYTRGVSGQCRPFRAGGIGTEGSVSAAEKSNAEQYFSNEAIDSSLQVLKEGVEASWKHGKIIKAPPGVDFDAGLTWEDIHAKEEKASVDEFDGQNEIHKEMSENNDHDRADGSPFKELPEPAVAERPKSAPLSTSMWTTKDFLDDDSLFGSSESSGIDSDDEEYDNAENYNNEKKRTGYFLEDNTSENDDDKHGKEETDNQKLKSILTESIEEINVSTDPNEVDELLVELSSSIANDKDKTTKRKGSDITNNPIELAERQSQDQQNSSRKEWANTKLLPIHDINTWIPNPAMTFPFSLDAFQQQAIVRLERNESVFVAAHTSAGKTVVAEYAVALAKQRGTRCVYTSPIKALSNQKFRDFSLKFGADNTGLITGDLQINADDSTVLIMTTEILRSMLYRGADLIRDIEWVIFDEVHYVNDTERGVVWEEVIIMLPPYVNLVFLSATTPNTLEFSDWIGRTKRKPVHVVKTDYRPVPLSHHLWTGQKLHKIMEGKSGFLEKGYAEAANALLPAAAKDANKKGSGQKGQSVGKPPSGSKQLAWQTQGSKQNWMSLIRFLDRELLTPTVVFSFSKKKCEEIANMLQSLDLNTAAEKGLVKGFALQTRARLSELDSNLPQVLSICEMVERGIGVHHGGLLPILKEMVELLFSRNLIKVLFATETFAMGVNMPARSVVFNSIRKHDGKEFRILQPGEYTQMAGRAGRRGLDAVGTVIICAFGSEPPPLPMLRNMLTGQSTRLSSQFRLTYNMILNLLRVEEMSVESMIKRSFSEFATQRALTANDYPKLLARGTHTLKKLEESFQTNVALQVGAEDVEDYFRACNELMTVNREILSYVIEATNGTGEGVLQPGRILLVSAARKHGLIRSPALVLRITTRRPGTQEAPSIICLALLPESFIPSDNPSDSKTNNMPAEVGHIGSAQHRYFKLCEVGLGEVLVITGQKHKISVKDFLLDDGGMGERAHHAIASPGGTSSSSTRRAELDNPFAGMKSLSATKNKDKAFDMDRTSKTGQTTDQAVRYLKEAEETEQNDGMPLLDLKDCARCGSDVVEFRQLYGRMADLLHEVRSYVSHKHPGLEKIYTPLERKDTLKRKVDTLRHMLSNESLSLFPDFLQRKAVLRKLGYVSDNETVCVKGRVACEVNTCDELVATEMVFEGILNDLEPPEIVAALSSLVFQDKSGEDELDVELPETLRTCCTQMKTIALNLGQLQKSLGLAVDPLEYCDTRLKFGLAHVVYEWALGVPFSKICELTLVQEGSIVRCITRLDELCREIRNCARVVGNPTLYRKMEAASVAIKRDIVFASSLYVS